MVGLSGNPGRTAYRIAKMLQDRGKRIVPIHPEAPTVLGEQGYASLADVPFPVDVVDVFRRSESGKGRLVPARRDRPRRVPAYDAGRGADGDGHLPRDRVGATPAVTTSGRDLVVSPGPGLPSGLVIPGAELVERFSRSSGPGGQSVNTADSRVELEYDVTESTVLSETQRTRALANLASRLVDGKLVIDASEHRSQHRNRVAARERLADLLRTALAPPPPPRRPTRPSRRARQRRLDAKRQRGETKALRGRVRDD